MENDLRIKSTEEMLTQFRELKLAEEILAKYPSTDGRVRRWAWVDAPAKLKLSIPGDHT